MHSLLAVSDLADESVELFVRAERQRDQYLGTVVDPQTGTIVYRCAEPLSSGIVYFTNPVVKTEGEPNPYPKIR